MSMELPVVIVHYESPATAVAAVASLRESTVPVAITVVDNGSTTTTTAALREGLAVVPVTIVESGDNLGFAGGANLGVSKALARHPDAEFVAVGAHDVEVAPNALARLLACAGTDRTIGVVAPRFHDLDDAGDAARFTEASRAATGDGKVLDEDWAVGALLVFRVACFQALGGFDPRLFLYYEDVDICRRARDAGWRVVLVEDALAFGHGHGIDDFVHRHMIVRNRMLSARWRKKRGAAARVVTDTFFDVTRCLIAASGPRRTSEQRAVSRGYARAEITGLAAGLRGRSGPPPGRV